LVLRQPNIELLQLGRQEVPVVLPGVDNGLVLEVLQHRIECEWLLRLLEYYLPNGMHELANIDAVQQSLAVLSVELDLLPLDADLIPLVILQIASVNHPKVEFDIQL